MFGPEILPIVSGEQGGTAVARVDQPDGMVLRASGAFEERGAHAAVISAGAITLCPAMALSPIPRSMETMETANRSFDLRDAYEHMVTAMRARGRVLVAFSGGVDSGLVARVAHDALGDNALAVLAYVEVITVEKLQRVEAAEGAIRALGFRIVRVRAHDGVARIEVPRADIPRIVAPEIAEKVARALRDAGFLYVTIDLLGYRSGSMNEGA